MQKNKTITDIPEHVISGNLITHQNGVIRQSKKLLDHGIKICDSCLTLNPFESLTCKCCKDPLIIIIEKK